jgi:hypothetical protein
LPQVGTYFTGSCADENRARELWYLECLGNERYKRRAEEIATAIRGTDGVELTVRAIEANRM